MAITVNKSPASAPGTVSYSISGNSVTLSYNPAGQPAGSNYKVDYWDIESYGYEVLEYLETDGTAYIDLGDHVSDTALVDDPTLSRRKWSKSMITDMHFSIAPGATVPTAVRYIYGCRHASSSNDSSTYLGLNGRCLGGGMHIFGTEASGAKLPATGDGVVHTIHQLCGYFKNGRRTDMIDLDERIKSGDRVCVCGCVDQKGPDAGINRWTKFNNVYLFAAGGDSGVPETTVLAGLRIHDFVTRMKPASDDTEKSFTLKPVRRSDGVLGMYDMFTGIFYTNAAASGNFIAGPSTGQHIKGKVKSESATIYYDSSKNLIIYACLYDATKTSGYVEGELDDSSVCFIKRNIQRKVNLSLENKIELWQTTNGGVNFIGSRAHVFYAENDGYIIGCSFNSTDMTTYTIFTIWCDDTCYHSFSQSPGGTNGRNFVSEFLPFKKGDYVCFGSASNYTDGGNGCAYAFYV